VPFPPARLIEGDDYSAHLSLMPIGATPIGLCSMDERVGALLIYKKKYYHLANEIMTRLDGRSIGRQLGSAGRTAELVGGRRRNVYLDDETRELATALCGKSVSKGLRIMAQEHKRMKEDAARAKKSE
jgi:hypothetical protein